jgi:hypothetical protein
MRSRVGRILTLGLIAGLVPAATAQATDRYVDANVGGGDANMGCVVAPPSDGCTLDNGITAADPGGDRVFMAAGTYAFAPSNGVSISDASLELIGAGSPQTTITTTATATSSLFINAAGVKVSGLRIVDSSTNGNAINVASGAGAVIERVSAITSGYAACLVGVGGTTTIRDSVCAKVGAGVGNPAIQVGNGMAPQLFLTNVTAYAGNTGGLALYAFAPSGQDTTVTVRNSILRAPAGTDILTFSAGAGDVATVDADYSDYASVTPANDAEHVVTLAGSLQNITPPAVFADTDTNFHQAAGSPTIDEGSAGFLAAPFLDVDGEVRPNPDTALPDIGADEFYPPPPAPPTTPAPTTTATTTAAPPAAKKKCKKGRKLRRGKCVRKKKR